MNGSGKYFVDTNVLLYALDSKEPFKADAADAWLDYLWEFGGGSLSWQVVHEFYSNAVRKMQMNTELAREAVLSYHDWPIAEVGLVTVMRAWHWMDLAQLTYWDGLILAAAEGSGCQWLLSEDFQHGRTYGSVTVINPFLQAPPDQIVH